MSTSHNHIGSLLLGILIGLSVMGPDSLSAGSSDRKKSPSTPLPTESSESPDGSQLRTDGDQSAHRPGPAWRTIGGTVKHIKGDVYTVEDYDGNQVQLYVSRETKRLRGQKKVGDRVRAEITREGFANSIQ